MHYHYCLNFLFLFVYPIPFPPLRFPVRSILNNVRSRYLSDSETLTVRQHNAEKRVTFRMLSGDSKHRWYVMDNATLLA